MPKHPVKQRTQTQLRSELKGSPGILRSRVITAELKARKISGRKDPPAKVVVTKTAKGRKVTTASATIKPVVKPKAKSAAKPEPSAFFRAIRKAQEAVRAAKEKPPEKAKKK